MFTLTQQRDEGLAHAPSAERIGFKCFPHRIETSVLRTLPLVVEDSRVVDEHVEFAQPLFDQALRGVNALLVNHV